MAKYSIPVPQDVSPSARRYVLLCIPDSVEYERMLLGSLYRLTQQSQYERDDTGTKALAIASQWSNTLENYFSMTDCDFCELMRDCIISGSLDDAISQVDSRVSRNANDAPLFESVSVCNDDDYLFGVATGITDYIHTIITDFFEVVEASTNAVELVAAISGAFPLFGQVVTSVSAIIDWMISSVGENYAANYTTAYRDEIRCELFCDIKPNCGVYDGYQLAEFFAARTPFVGDLLAHLGADTRGYWNDSQRISFMQNLATYVTSGTWNGTEIVDLFHFMFASCLAGQISFFGVYDGKHGLDTVIKLSANNPDSDHTILCECSGTWEHTIDFANDTTHSSLVAMPNGTLNGVHVPGVGYQTTQPVGSWRLEKLRVSLPSPRTITEFRVYWSNPSSIGSAGLYVNIHDSDGSFMNVGGVSGNSLRNEGSFAAEQTYPDVGFYDIVMTFTGTSAGAITSVRIRGEGTNPYV